MRKIKLLLVDDHAVLRSGLRLLLSTQPDMEVVGEGSSGEEALELTRELKPDLVVLDLTMPGRSGFEVLEDLKRQSPKVKVLVLTMHEDEEYLRHVLKYGGNGYILKRAADVELLSAIRAVARGEVFIEPAMTQALVKDLMPKGDPGGKKEHGLSDREKEVLKLVALGFTNQQVADTLTISIKTVESHKARIKEKLNLSRRSDLVRYALAEGLLPNK